ncbi:hypothetical protein UFOVP231_86 [uncultured Caudovirales phage]|uniref:Uncharacterized protein n=1 Tax=uncultured Caudovirales phage TaxID=2100421 RepID=A0A6J7WVN6_9CAUD|nr:hypothetical protein UFOVP231_86 [uncultured Caudovirales phage]
MCCAMGKLIALHVLRCVMLGKRVNLLKLKKSQPQKEGLSRSRLESFCVLSQALSSFAIVMIRFS